MMMRVCVNSAARDFRRRRNNSKTSCLMPTRLIWVFIISLFGHYTIQGAVGEANSVDEGTVQPSFFTKGQTYRIVIGDTVVLPCEVNNPGSYMIAWRHGFAVLSAGTVKVSPDPRLQLVDGYNLQIRGVTMQDAGDYVCQIATLTPKEITHTLEILVPPRLTQLMKSEVEFKKGDMVTLECRASGNPVPKIIWTRKNNVLPSGEKSMEGQRLVIENINRHQAGVYVCTANNGVGDPVSRNYTLRVKYPPEIEVERGWVHSGEGKEAQLVCIVHGEPSPDVVWYRDTLRLDTTEHRITEVRGSRHTMILRKVSGSDFGNYSCVADNTLGRQGKFLELSGKPCPAQFESLRNGRSKESYNISWSVNSFTPIEEYKLYYRRVPTAAPQQLTHGSGGLLTHPQPVQGPKRPARRQQDDNGPNHSRGGDWLNVIIPSSPNSQSQHRMSYLIRNLDPGTHYQAEVASKNRFGWSAVSERFQFSTRDPENSLYEPSPEPAVFAGPEVRDLTAPAQTSSTASKLNAITLLMATLIVAGRLLAV